MHHKRGIQLTECTRRLPSLETCLSYLLVVLGIHICVTSCAKQEEVTLEKPLALYRENKLDQALPLFEQVVAREKRNATAFAWFAETCRRLGRKEEAVVASRSALALEPCNSFAHTVIAEACNPVFGLWSGANSDTTWSHLMQAIQCDSSDGNPWVTVFTQAIERNDPPMMQRSLQRLVETGFLTSASLSYARWMLRTLPERSVLITSGDMDTYPPLAVQEVERFRRDVTVVNRSLLNTIWYERFIRDTEEVPMPFEDARLEALAPLKDDSGRVVTTSDQILRAWFDQKAKGTLARPLAVAVSVEEACYAEVKDRMRYAGPFLVWQSRPTGEVPDTAALRASLLGVDPTDLRGDWVSQQDRSPIRRIYSRNVVKNVTAAAVAYSTWLIKANKFSDARQWLSWAENLERQTELGPVFTGKIAELRKAAGGG